MSQLDEKIYFLHIGKTGGSYVEKVVKDNELTNFVICPHHVRASDLPKNARYLVSLRDPATRFYSSFYSRLRRGRPKYNRPWSLAELVSFSFYSEPEKLLESLSKDSLLAKFAMRNIRHVRDYQSQWLDTNHPPEFIFRQESLISDLRIYFSGKNVKIPEGKVHSNDLAYPDKYNDFIRSIYKEDFLLWKNCQN